MKLDTQEKQIMPPMSKKVTMVIIIVAAVLFLLVAIAIMRSGDTPQRGATPETLFEPSAKSAQDLELLAERNNEIPLMPEILYDEPVEEPVDYVDSTPLMYIEEKRRTDHGLRTLAANATTALNNFHLNNPAIAVEGQNQPLQNDPNAHLQTEIAAAERREAEIGASGGEKKDPNGWDSKERFVAAGQGLEGYSKHFRTPQLVELEIKAGTVIPCVLINGINSDLPGNCIGQVTENIYDSATGKNVLIPKGSKVVGAYDNRIAYGQSRILAVWSKIVYPDGSTLMLENLSAADPSGYTGYKGQVNRHWNTLVSTALVVSLLGAGVDLATPSTPTRNNDDEEVGSVLAENAGAAIAAAIAKVLERETDRAPTIKIKPGKRFILFVRQDIAFGDRWK